MISAATGQLESEVSTLQHLSSRQLEGKVDKSIAPDSSSDQLNRQNAPKPLHDDIGAFGQPDENEIFWEQMLQHRFIEGGFPDMSGAPSQEDDWWDEKPNVDDLIEQLGHLRPDPPGE